jgi:hypothetical protein
MPYEKKIIDKRFYLAEIASIRGYHSDNKINNRSSYFGLFLTATTFVKLDSEKCFLKLRVNKLKKYVQWRPLIWKHRPNLVYWIFELMSPMSSLSAFNRLSQPKLICQ